MRLKGPVRLCSTDPGNYFSATGAQKNELFNIDHELLEVAVKEDVGEILEKLLWFRVYFLTLVRVCN